MWAYGVYQQDYALEAWILGNREFAAAHKEGAAAGARSLGVPVFVACSKARIDRLLAVGSLLRVASASWRPRLGELPMRA